MPKKSVKKTASHASKVKISKAAFVRSLPTTMSAKEVVASGKSQGIGLTDAYVYNVRATSKAAKLGGRRPPPRGSARNRAPRSRRGPVTVKLSGARDVEDLLRAVAAELGLARAIAVLEAEHSRVHRLLGH